jgi:hypothetical protein
LPQDLAQLKAKMGNVNLDATVGDDGQWWMERTESVAYSKELDTYPVGTVIPAVLIERPFARDRSDVAAIATWKDGWWRMEVRRRLDTKSRFALPITDGVFLWVAAFDQDQARHTRHVHPIRITLEN